MDHPCVVLASESPRRQALLQYLGVPFETVPSAVDEVFPPDMGPADIACTLPRRKAAAVALRQPECVVIGADTVVARGDVSLGKPVDVEDALAMLRWLGGVWHDVHTGVAVAHAGTVVDAVVTARVHMRAATEAELRAYVDSGEPMDKAGAYAVQGLGASLIDAVDGCYLAVVGFPLRATARLLQSAGVMLGADVDQACRAAVADLRRQAGTISPPGQDPRRV